jgi:hypothetical protein
LTVTQRPVAVRRWNWTTRPANERAPATRVAKRPLTVRRSDTAGRTPTSVAGLRPPFQPARYEVPIVGFARYRQAPPVVVKTVAIDLNDPPPNVWANTVTTSPARPVGTVPESVSRRP